MSYIAAGIAAAGLAYEVGSSISEKKKAKAGLEELNQTAFPEIGVAPELRSAYEGAQGRSKYGFSPEETAAFNQQLARSQATRFQAARDAGGGQIAGTINRMGNVENIGAINTFASQGAALKQNKAQYADSLAGSIQNIKTANDEQKIAQRVRLEQSFGGAAKQQQENINNAIGQGVSIAAQAAGSRQAQKNFDTYYGNQGISAPPDLSFYNPGAPQIGDPSSDPSQIYLPQ